MIIYRTYKRIRRALDWLLPIDTSPYGRTHYHSDPAFGLHPLCRQVMFPSDSITYFKDYVTCLVCLSKMPDGVDIALQNGLI